MRASGRQRRFLDLTQLTLSNRKIPTSSAFQKSTEDQHARKNAAFSLAVRSALAADFSLFVALRHAIPLCREVRVDLGLAGA
jgi:hypothetical protein